MSYIYTTYTWQPVDLNAVCELQDGELNVPLILNGTLADPITNKAYFAKNGSIRSVSLTSANDLSAAEFTVIGVQNGIQIQESIIGPNNNTVYTNAVFDEIHAVIPFGLHGGIVAAGIQVGTGNKGFFPMIQVNTRVRSGVLAYGLQVILLTGMVTYNIKSTLQDNITRKGGTFKTLTGMVTYLDDQNTNLLAQETKMASHYLVEVTAAQNATKLKLIYSQV